MSQYNPLQILSFVAGADLSGKQYFGVKLNGTTERSIVLGGSNEGTADGVIGFLQDEGVSGAFLGVAVEGTSKAVAAGVIAANALVKLDAAGKIVTGGAGSDKNVAIALEAAAADGDIIEVMLLKPHLLT